MVVWKESQSVGKSVEHWVDRLVVELVVKKDNWLGWKTVERKAVEWVGLTVEQWEPLLVVRKDGQRVEWMVGLWVL